MPTTSLKLPDDLKQRAANAAQQLGMSPHAFMVSAIEQAATATELRTRFIADAKEARYEMIESGKGFKADDVHAYLKAKVSGKKVVKPKAHSWHV
jgi:predicted transcriptional regulator